MNIEDEITVKAGLRTTKVLVEFSPDGAGGWLVRQLFPTGDRGDMDMLACERFFGSISALAEIVEAEIHARHGQSEIIPNPETCRNAMARRFAEDLDDLIAAIYPSTH